MRQSEKPRNVALFTYWSLNCKQEEGLPYWLAGDKQGKQHQQERNGRLLVNANKIAEYNAPTNGWVHLKGTTQNTLRLFRCWHFSAPECAVIRLSKENNVANVDMLNAKKRPLNRWCNQIFFLVWSISEHLTCCRCYHQSRCTYALHAASQNVRRKWLPRH